MDVKTVSINLAKEVFQIHGVDEHGKPGQPYTASSNSSAPRNDKAQVGEAQAWVKAINRMTGLGMPVRQQINWVKLALGESQPSFGTVQPGPVQAAFCSVFITHLIH